MLNTNRCSERGTTMIELIVAMLIGAILLLLVTRFFASQNRTFEQQVDASELLQNLRAGVDLMSREARRAGYDPHLIGFPGIQYDSSSLIIRADLNADGDTADADEHIEYHIESDGRIVRTSYTNGVSDGGQELLDHVERLSVVYLDADGDTITDASGQASIRQLRLGVTLRSSRRLGAAKDGDGYRREDMQVLVVPLNLGL